MFKYFRKKFPKRIPITFHLKSGKEFTVLAEKCKVTKDGNADITSYTLEGIKGNSFLYLRLDDISAITY